MKTIAGLIAIAVLAGSSIAADKPNEVDPEAYRAATEKLGAKLKPQTQPTNEASSYPKIPNGYVPLYPKFNARNASQKSIDYVTAIEQKRVAQVAEAERQIIELQREKRAENRKQIEELKSRIAGLKRGTILTESDKLPEKLVVGNIGKWPLGKVFTIIVEIRDKNAMMVRGIEPDNRFVPRPSSIPSGQLITNSGSQFKYGAEKIDVPSGGAPVLIRGISTVGLNDDQNIGLEEVFEVVASEKIGGKTYSVLKVVDIKSWLDGEMKTPTGNGGR